MSSNHEGLLCRGPVYPDFIRLGRVLSEIFDVAQHMASAVLAHEVAKVGSKAHIAVLIRLRTAFCN